MAVDAVRTGKEKIDKESLEDSRLSPQLLSMMGHLENSAAP
jgi:hypothetical protein